MAFDARSVTINSVTKLEDRTIVQLSDGNGMEFSGSWDDFVCSIESRLNFLDSSYVACFALARWIAANPTGENPEQITGKNVTLNIGATNTTEVFTIV